MFDMNRVVVLEGGVNVRDLGGYRTCDGRTVKWRKILRSGHLAYLTASDLDVMEEIGVSKIHDLRGEKEQRRMPSQPIRAEFISDYQVTAGSLTLYWDLLKSGQLTAETSHQTFVELYRNCVNDVIPPFRRLLTNVLSHSEQTHLLHCSAGKDRTGMASALILSALGVPREIIIEDYLLTSHHLDSESVFEMVEDYLRANKIHWQREWLKPLAIVHKDFIESFFASIEEQYGSVDGYLIKGFGLEEADLSKLKNEFLES